MDLQQELYKREREILFPHFEEELQTVLPNNYWEELKQYSDGTNEKGEICTHTINVVYRAQRDPIYKEQFNDYDRNVMQWATLLHDIEKKCWPLFLGRDHIHPFMSAKEVLKIFKHLGFIKLDS